MPNKNKDLAHLVKEAKIYASIEANHQKLLTHLENRGIKLSDKPIEQLEKDLLASMQRQGMDLSKHPSVKKMAEHYGLLSEEK